MTTLIKIGNSQGIRIPKAIIEQAHLQDKDLKFKVTDEGLLIQPVKKHREGWKEQFDKAIPPEAAGNEDQEWLDAQLTDEGEWEW